MIGTTIKQYKILDQLGEGGMGVVYLAEDSRLNRQVALKFITGPAHATSEERQRFEREAQAAARLNHPNICTVYELGESEEHAFIALEYIKGSTLKHLMQEGPIPAETLKDWLTQIAAGLQAAHEQGVIHRDIKPANIMISEHSHLKIMDFGIARLSDAETELTRANSTIGTINYMSPEQARGEVVDQRTDIWSLGVILYELATGKRPFSGAFREAILYAMMNTAPRAPSQLNPDLPEALNRIILRCLERDVDARYDSLQTLLNDLKGEIPPAGQAKKRAVSPVSSSTASPNQTGPVTILGSRRRRVAAGSIVALLAVLFLFPSLRKNLTNTGDRSGLPAAMHLAVLPFDTISNAEEDRAFSNGLAHLVATNLMRMEHDREEMWIIPVREVLSQEVTSASQAKESFDVNLTVSGTIVNLPGSIQISLDVTDARTLRVIDSGIIELPEMDPTLVQDQVMQELATMLELRIPPTTKSMLLTGHTNDPEAYKMYVQGMGFIQRYEEEENVDEAIRLFEKAIEIDSTYALAYAGSGFALGRKYALTREISWLEQARSQSARALTLNDDAVEVWITRGRILMDNTEYEEATAALERALQIDPDNYEAHRRLGAVMMLLGNNERAEEHLKKAIAIQPRYWDGYNVLAIVYARSNRSDDAIAYLQKAIELSPTNVTLYTNLSMQYRTQGNYAAAIEQTEKALVLGPDPDLSFQLGFLHRIQGNDSEAISYLIQSTTEEPQDPNFWMLLGDTYFELNDTEQGNAAMNRVIALADDYFARINQDNDEMLWLSGLAYAKLNDFTSARAALQRYVDLGREDGRALFYIAGLYENIGERERALDYMEQMFETGYEPSILENSSYIDDLVQSDAYQALVARYR